MLREFPLWIAHSRLVLQFSFKYNDLELVLDPLRSTIDLDRSNYRVGQVKIEVILVKIASIRWGTLVEDNTTSSMVSFALFRIRELPRSLTF